MKKIIKKILGYKSAPSNVAAKKTPDFVKAGTNVHLSKANFVSRSSTNVSIVIGNDCVIESSFVLECSDAKISIGDRTFIGGKGLFVSSYDIKIGSDVMFSWGCTVIDNDAHSLNYLDRINDVKDWKRGVDEGKIGFYKDWSKVNKGRIIIDDRVWVGFNVIILKNVHIGEGAVVAAGSVVTKDVEPYTLVGGNPARFIKKLEKE